MMDPRERFRHNLRCWAYGRAGEGHIVIHSKKERRYRCKRCEKTFSETKGTALYRAHKPHELIASIVTLLAYGCPVQAIVAAFGLDERTIARWQRESGRHQCQRVHEHLVQAGGVLLTHVVQADELRIRIGGGVLWLASALSVTSRLWLGGVVRVRRDRRLRFARSLSACALVERSGAFCFAPMGWQLTPQAGLERIARASSHWKARASPAPFSPEGLMVAQAIKRYARRRVVGVLHRVACGTQQEAVEARLRSTQGDWVALINTAYIERLQATSFRSRLAPLARRMRAAVRQEATLEAGMWLIGTVYNFCRAHRSLTAVFE